MSKLGDVGDQIPEAYHINKYIRMEQRVTGIVNENILGNHTEKWNGQRCSLISGNTRQIETNAK